MTNLKLKVFVIYGVAKEIGTKEMEIGVMFILQKMGYGTFSSKKGEVEKLLRESNLY